MKKKTGLERTYEKDNKTNSFSIDLAIGRYNDIFNDLDPAPFRKRDIDTDLHDYIIECSSDIPLKYNLNIRFQISEETRNLDKEERIKTGLKTYFSFIMNKNEKKRKKNFQHNIFYIFIAFVFLFSAFYLETKISNKIFYNTLLEGLFIGGWVFLWESIYSFMFRYKDLNHRCKLFRRLYRAPIIFYKEIS